MRRRQTLWSTLPVLFALLAGWGVAVAQESSPEGDADAETAEVPVRRRADLSGPEQLAETEKIFESATMARQRVAGLLDEARREADMIKVTCLNDKLTQINANYTNLEKRVEELKL